MHNYFKDNIYVYRIDSNTAWSAEKPFTKKINYNVGDNICFGSLLINMSNLRTMGTRESSKGTSIATSQTLKEPLPYKVLLSYPDPRLTIGARIPIPFQ
jgi:hypothetical protein